MLRSLLALCLLSGCQEIYCHLDGGTVRKVRVWRPEPRFPEPKLVVRTERICDYSWPRWGEQWYLREP